MLHFVGANDDYIAREFQRRFFRSGCKGAAVGAGAALVADARPRLVRLDRCRASPAGDQIEALFGSFGIGWRGVLLVVLIALAVAVDHRHRVAADGETIS